MTESPGRRDGMSGGGQPAAEPAAKTAAKTNQGFIWTQDGRYVRPIKVNTGLSDGTMTEVQGEEVKEGMEVIIGEQRQGANNAATTNPFAPQMMRSSR
jgi:HlyD family secretion protein